MKADIINDKDITGYTILLNSGITITCIGLDTDDNSYIAYDITVIDNGNKDIVQLNSSRKHVMLINPAVVDAILMQFKEGVELCVKDVKKETTSDLDPTNWEPHWDVQS